MDVVWSELPQDIVESISKRLTIYADYLRFRCVCRSWSSSVAKTPVHLPPQLPWLMISHNSFFNLSSNKIHHLNLPSLYYGHTGIFGSSYGWLVILEETAELSLVNPITRATTSLPSLQTFPELVALLSGYTYNNHHLIKVVLSSNPSLSDDDFVAFAILNRRDFVFCKKGYNSWVLLNYPGTNNHTWIDAVYKNGSFFVISTSGIIAVCDLDGSPIFLHENISFSNHFNNTCYTVFAGEDMLLVKLKQSTVMEFDIFKMNWNVLEWEKIQTLGEYSLFIGKLSSL
ncbi:unnamed protein product [Trifolium pratense]|uniref:Uncharacterized protein n=1 Tax=Trifolium pratense TaxID=57577 RepID=A0ACB0JCT3_TRIPR|nr:unnamed protein product [Trifolium pratense]